MQLQTYAVHFLYLSHSFLLEIWGYLAEKEREREREKEIWFGHECSIKPP